MQTRGAWLVLAGCFASCVSSQTITVDGDVIAAGESNISPAAEVVNGVQDSRVTLPEEELQLTDDILGNLTGLQLSNVSVFYFGDDESEDHFTKRELDNRWNGKCKTFPGDLLFPGKPVWKVLDLLTGGAVISTVPLGAACYEGEHYDAKKCEFLFSNWANSSTHVVDPTSVMSPLFQGATCQPQDAEAGSVCEISGFPLYSIKATNVAHIQLAVNMARNLNLRLVVHNTGHDFLGKSTGAGALSIWTHNMKSIQVLKEHKTKSYNGPAFKVGAGVQVRELYETAERNGFTAVGGECRDVGVAGGYAAGGGHSPLSPLVGLASDQILSVDIVTPQGRFITVDEENHEDLFWAIRGGGAATWGVVTSMTFKVATSSLNISETQFWSAVEAYWSRFPDFSDAKSYEYHFIFPAGPDAYLWSMNSWVVPGTNLADFKKLVEPLLQEWESLGVNIKPEYFEHDSFYPMWRSHFPSENVGTAEVRTGSRLIPRGNFEDKELWNKTFKTLRGIAEDGATLIMYNINAAAPEGTPASAVNPAWRDALMFVITGSSWAPDATEEEISETNRRVTYEIMQSLKDITPGGGGYGNEGDVIDPDFGQSFFGSNYKRLYNLKKKIDPLGVFYAPTAVDSEDWYIEGQDQYLTRQTGKLCHRWVFLCPSYPKNIYQRQEISYLLLRITT
ncbi:uncharacterized protein F5Z01DRAFT_704948 [Emericellopsis atlantica]|uniref:FAD-binding PCMH-type domain-containing protein n=1 Tax=Emericellopsis atlantica TaxID=2614577 RepID=A0A9P8CS96_9HYPO|nr:uncharacterized protein F5Z01DRAFT_704948 [Emericellopsis atlantica]KAG9255526.1 hypothetical protein F5Z01DRAFT_704948 [Emericellopsis atlantica]